MSISRTLAKNTAFNFIGSFLDLGIAFITGMMITRGLGTEQYGTYSYAIWLLALANLFTNLGLGEMSRRFIPEAIGHSNEREVLGYVQLSFVIRAVVAIIVFFAVTLSSGFWAQQSGDQGNSFLFILIAVTVIPNTIQDWISSVFKGFQKFDYSLYISLATYPLRVLVIVIFMIIGFGVQELLLLNIATFCLGILIGFVLLRRLVPLKGLFSLSSITSDEKKQALKYSLTVAAMLFLGYLVSQRAEVFFIGRYSTVDDVGFYNLAFRVGSLAGIFPLAFSYVLLPVIAEQFGSGKTEKFKEVFYFSSRYLMMIAFPLAIGGMALADSLIIVLFGAEYRPAVILFQLICLPLAVSSINGGGDSIIRGINRPDYLLKTQVVLAIINISLCFWLIPKYGVMGATIASSVPLILNFPFYAIFLYKQVGVSFSPWDSLKIAIASLIMGITVYLLHRGLSLALGLILGIPLGFIVYIVALLILGEIGERDLAILRKLQNSLPPVLRKYYISLMGLLERIIVRRKLLIRRRNIDSKY
jgi:stage V sporulation protein B